MARKRRTSKRRKISPKKIDRAIQPKRKSSSAIFLFLGFIIMGVAAAGLYPIMKEYTSTLFTGIFYVIFLFCLGLFGVALYMYGWRGWMEGKK